MRFGAEGEEAERRDSRRKARRRTGMIRRGARTVSSRERAHTCKDPRPVDFHVVVQAEQSQGPSVGHLDLAAASKIIYN
jgi:hypothetical protein